MMQSLLYVKDAALVYGIFSFMSISLEDLSSSLIKRICVCVCVSVFGFFLFRFVFIIAVKSHLLGNRSPSLSFNIYFHSQYFSFFCVYIRVRLVAFYSYAWPLRSVNLICSLPFLQAFSSRIYRQKV